MRWVALCILGAALGASPDSRADAAPAGPELGSERVVFHTVAGDLVFALYPKLAPRTVEHFLAAVRAGTYDTTSFARIVPGFIAQVSVAQDRTRPLTEAQVALLKNPVPLEVSALRHVRGALSLAHPDGDPNGGQTSFCVMLGSAPHLDGKYTVFGRLESGEDVLAELVKVPRNDRTPIHRLTIDRAEVIDVSLPGPHYLSAAHPVGTAFGASTAEASGPLHALLAAGLAAIILLSFAGAQLRPTAAGPIVHALLLVVMLVAAFLLMTVLLPEAPLHPWLGCLLFFGVAGLFKALGRFEPAAER